MIRNWRNLEELSLGATDKNLEQILEQVSIHFKKLYSLCLSNTQTSSIHGGTARSIVSFLPNIKHLTLRNCGELRPEDLVTIIRGCKDLVYLDVRNSSTLLVGDEQLAKLASHIGTVLFDRSNVAYLNFREVVSIFLISLSYLLINLLRAIMRQAYFINLFLCHGLFNSMHPLNF